MERSELEFFNSENAETYDMLFKHLFGGLPLQDKVEEYTLNNIVDMVELIYFEKWTKQYNLIYNEIVDGVSSETVSKSKDDETRNRESTRNSENNVSAFNDVEYSPDDENKENTNELDEYNRTHENTDTKKSLWAVNEQMRIREQTFIKSVIMKDVKEIMITKIY